MVVSGVCCVLLSGVARAAENCSGNYTSVGHAADTQDLGNGVTLTSFSAMSSSSRNNTEDLLVGACTGYVLTMADGKVRVVYACARKNKAGDVVVDEGSLEPGADRGTGKYTSGTGTLAKRVGDSGWWKNAVDNNGKVTIGVWGGTCK